MSEFMQGATFAIVVSSLLFGLLLRAEVLRRQEAERKLSQIPWRR